MNVAARSLGVATLARTLAPSARVIGDGRPQITGITSDSRDVAAGDLFVALRGEHSDGHRYIAQALSRGAVAALVEDETALPAGTAGIVVGDATRALSQVAATFYGRPSDDMVVAGVTGTNGKTTTVQMIGAIFDAAGMRSGTIGTLGARAGAREWQLANTTPPAHELHQLFAQMRGDGVRAVAMEVSSHALALARVEDVHFDVAGFTNLTRDHLDFHGTLDAYAAAKRRLFDMARRAVLNIDDEYGAAWANALRGTKPVLTYSFTGAAADLAAHDLDSRADGTRFYVGRQRFRVQLPGAFNVANALCAIGIARSLDIGDATSARGLQALARVPGRMEHARGDGVDVVVDYSHTPDSLRNALHTLRPATRGRLIVVFGCGGDRDRGKRPQMGEIAAQLADFSYLTSDNPRGEEPGAIVEEILPGIGDAPHAVQLDRRAAIESAVQSARAGDVVLIAGKGHETYQVVGDRALAFDDLAVAREALARRSGART